MAQALILHGVTMASARRTLEGVAKEEATPPPKVAVKAIPTSDTGYAAGHAKGLEEGLRQGLAEALREAEPRVETLVEERVAQRCAKRIAELDAQTAARQAEHERQLAVLESVVKAWELALPARAAALERDAAALAYVALERLCGSEAAQDRAPVVAGLVRQGWAHLEPEGVATARLAPRDMDILEADEAFAVWRASHHGLTLKADASLTPGACVLEGRHGAWDMGLATQMAQLKAVWVQQVC